MTGGVIYIADRDGSLKKKNNPASIVIGDLAEDDVRTLKALIQRHHQYTGSSLAADLLAGFDKEIKPFKKISPLAR
jgi:glutamate synthase (NADPH/NADH) large chain